jgi:RNA polymerase sigma-70 factor (ECF subfamily)
MGVQGTDAAGRGEGPLQPALAQAASLGFDALYEAEFDFVYRVVARLGGHGHVEDLVQEVFVVVSRRLADYRGEGRVTTWLFRIAYRVVGAHIRRDRLQRRILELFGAEHAPPQPFAVMDAERAADAHHVHAALGRLSFEKRSALVLFEVEGWSCEEIAEALEIPLGTVYTRLHHARRDFKKAYSRVAVKEPA